MTAVEPLPIDWQQVLRDIATKLGAAGEPLGTRGLASVLRSSRGSVRNVLDAGGEPGHSTGERWVAIWCKCTRRSGGDVPRKVAPLSAAGGGLELARHVRRQCAP